MSASEDAHECEPRIPMSAPAPAVMPALDTHRLRRILLAAVLALLFETLDLGLRNLAVRYPAGIILMYLNALLPVAIGCLFLLDENRRLSVRRAALPHPVAGGAA